MKNTFTLRALLYTIKASMTISIKDFKIKARDSPTLRSEDSALEPYYDCIVKRIQLRSVDHLVITIGGTIDE